MGNVLHSDLCIHKSFDVKGSHGRSSSEAGVDESNMSENDLDIVFHLDTSMRNTFILEVQHDCNFMEEIGIGVTDYSLLLGIHLPTPILGDPSKSPAHPGIVECYWSWREICECHWGYLLVENDISQQEEMRSFHIAFYAKDHLHNSGVGLEVLFVGINICSTMQPIVSIQRTVVYRERAACMYSAVPYALAQGMSYPLDCSSLQDMEEESGGGLQEDSAMHDPSLFFMLTIYTCEAYFSAN